MIGERFHLRNIMKYKRVIGIPLLVLGLLMTIGAGMQYAFFEPPPVEQQILSAAITPSETPVPPPVAEQITFGPALPATSSPSITPTPLISASPSSAPKQIAQPTVTPTYTITPTSSVTPTQTVRIETSVEPSITETPTPTAILANTPTPTPIAPQTDDSVWDELAQCESSGHWDDNTGNGYFGGLQFSQGTWESVGGTGSPAQASKEEQITRAKILQARSGWNAWGGCAHKLGLL